MVIWAGNVDSVRQCGDIAPVGTVSSGRAAGATQEMSQWQVLLHLHQHPGWPQCAGGHITHHISMCHTSHWRVSRPDRPCHVMSCQVQICLMTRGGTVDLCYEFCRYSFNETRHKVLSSSVMKVNSWPSLVWWLLFCIPPILRSCNYVVFSSQITCSTLQEKHQWHKYETTASLASCVYVVWMQMR